MRITLLVVATLAASPVSSQKMLPAADWCAKGKKMLAALPLPNAAPDTRSDSIDIQKTTLDLDVSDFAGKTIHGSAKIEFAAKVPGVTEMRLDLLGMTIDSVVSVLGPNWAYDGKSLQIQWPAALNAGDTASLQVYYRGKPAEDASGWGGFYWQGEYAYNLGVGFAADPHNYGRAWFPCFDNFEERCQFDFRIFAPPGKTAFCNGILLANVSSGNGSHWYWRITDPIPSYLACVAVGPFASFERAYAGEQGTVPVQIAVAAADTNKLIGSFTHLPDALVAFEHWFGPYRWDKIGYSVVPFGSGAMEHATNIAYMRAAVDGTTNGETLMAHELSHHWWGDLATCSTAEDMWLNEGWAVYSEHLFLEHVYGPNRYADAVAANFLDVLENAHVQEGGYRAVSGVPHAYTYGRHVYNKGAVVAHNLRGYLGDSLFRSGLRAVLDENQFADWSSADLLDKLSAATGRDLTDFFEDWVFQPGFADFSVDTVAFLFSPIDAGTKVIALVVQKRRGAPAFHQNVPIEFTFVDVLGNRQYRTATVSGEKTIVEFTLPSFGPAPSKVWVNTQQRICQARTDKEWVVKTLQTHNFSPAKLNIKVTSLPADSALIRVEHHYAMPDTAGNANPHGYTLSNRYWTVDALHPFAGEATFLYDGRGVLDQLDTELFAQTGPSEDSIVLLYRPNPGHPWMPHPNYTKNIVTSNQDRFGFLRTNQTALGQYAIAKGNATVSAAEVEQRALRAKVTPNPTSGTIRIQAEHPFEQVQVFSTGGDLQHEVRFENAKTANINTANWPDGAYWFVLWGYGRAGVVGPIVKTQP
ncbi:MAG: M1 family metallopeptidase [Saprospiraceae bacterium]